MDYNEVFDRHYDALFRYLHRLTGDEDLAEDLAQETFVRLLEQPVSEDGIRSWLFTVGRNLLRDRSRVRTRREELLDQFDTGPSRPERPDEATERRERVKAVRDALDQLSERDRTILLLREEGFKYAEIAEVIGVATSSVGTLLARALRRFENAYDREDTAE